MGEGFAVDPEALRAAAGQLDEHAGEVAARGEALGARTAGPVGRGAIGEVVESAVRRGIGIVAHDMSRAVEKFYADAAAVMRRAAAETERTDGEARSACDALARDREAGDGRPNRVLRRTTAVTGHLGGRGSFAGREFNRDQAGGPIVRLDYATIRVTPKGADVVQSHLQRFVGRGQLQPEEARMLSRLHEIAAGRLAATEYDLRFYSHELRESVRYRRLGFPTGQPRDPDEAYELWNNAHTATLADYSVDERQQPLYLPGLLPR
jgi:hypothetical protein